MDEHAPAIDHDTTPDEGTTLSRRGLLRAAGIASAAAAAASMTVSTARAAGGHAATGALQRSQDSTPTPKTGGTLNAAMQVDVVGLDPHLISSYSSTLVTEEVYNGMIQLDENANILPDLAESWTVSADGLTYDFKLRTDVKFHNGRAMTADDVVYSLNRVKDPNFGSPNGYLLVDVASITAPTPDSVQITMNKPFSALLSHMG